MISPALLAQALPSAGSGVDWLYQFTNNLTNLTTQNGGALTQLGLIELSCIALFTLISSRPAFGMRLLSTASTVDTSDPLRGASTTRTRLSSAIRDLQTNL
jgi:hypothetical protein